MHRSLLRLVLGGMLLPAAVWGQTPPEAGRNLEVDPIRCWWRTSAGAVRVGENFSVVLTCAVLQNDAVQVVPDESRLDAAVAQMAPFEVIGGTHPADLYGPNRRFFQYEYRLRIINPDVIGKDVGIPDPQIHYRINSTVAANMALQGRDHTYLLPPQSVRVLSLVPADAPDIRDSANEGFAEAEQLGFRANVLRIVAFTAMALGGLIAFVGVARLIVGARKGKAVGPRGLSEWAILRLASRELAAVQREKSAQGWNEDLVGRALAAARITAAGALGRPVHEQRGPGAQSGEGRLLVGGRRWRWRRRSPAVVSGAATPETLSRALDTRAVTNPARRQMLEDLQRALATFTAVQYGREPALERAALDEALSRAIAATRRLGSEAAWPKSSFRRWTPRVQAQRQA
jgi:hypothetical protein